MIVKTSLKVGAVAYQYEIEEKDDMDAMHKSIVLGNVPQYCHECKNDTDFRMDSNKDKEGNTYINVICRACGAKAKLGRYKTGGYFWHKFEKYVPKADESKPGIKNAETDELVDGTKDPHAAIPKDKKDLPF